MKKISLGVTFLWIAVISSGQVTMQPNIPAAGMIQKNQLWNIMTVNNTNRQYDCRLEMILRDRVTGIEVMTATTGTFILSPGAKQLSVNIIAPVQYNYLTTGMDTRLQGLIPVGNYSICYALSNIALKENNLAEECVQFDAEPLSPPMLIFPTDSSEMETAPSQLSWASPTPQAMFDKLRYEIVISQINDGQKPAEAIEENLPFYTDGSLPNNVLNYPGTATNFEKDKWYAWQVIAKDDKSYAAKSEVWVFKISTLQKKATTSSDIYLLLKDNITSTYEINSSTLHIKYFSNAPSYEGQISIKNERGELIKTTSKTIRPGDNYLEFSLGSKFHAGNIYSVSLTDNNKKNHVLTFTINKN